MGSRNPVFTIIIGTNALQHTATHWNTLQYTAIHCNTLQYTATATHCSTLVLQSLQSRLVRDSMKGICRSTAISCCASVAVCCSVLQCVAVCCSVLQCIVLYCVAACQCEGLLRDLMKGICRSTAISCRASVAVCCSVLQCVAVCCSVLQCVSVR